MDIWHTEWNEPQSLMSIKVRSIDLTVLLLVLVCSEGIQGKIIDRTELDQSEGKNYGQILQNTRHWWSQFLITSSLYKQTFWISMVDYGRLQAGVQESLGHTVALFLYDCLANSLFLNYTSFIKSIGCRLMVEWSFTRKEIRHLYLNKEVNCINSVKQ